MRTLFCAGVLRPKKADVTPATLSAGTDEGPDPCRIGSHVGPFILRLDFVAFMAAHPTCSIDWAGQGDCGHCGSTIGPSSVRKAAVA